ncbi:TonB-dependent receptor plug domain-containing protein [Gloeobacter kilaueensis]|uniref:TonB-dependent receptor n=1 Tax=Gloeobacter kilaueensis (strain ATCC BAA-2537 / CCAP 1431/1 / ULC 316 / JS1) TaxID=1183438 RepID=U5QCW5_GLOK1|nr:TonB-dependent receptor [Gloeobacter kilaueensis]AGY56762.1 TonB-dependent receptor [Gloeobacter kilaueensis JS1]
MFNSRLVLLVLGCSGLAAMPLLAEPTEVALTKKADLLVPTSARLLSDPLLAQQPVLKTTGADSSGGNYLLDEVTVTSNRRAVRLKDTSSTVYIVDRKELERKGANSVGEAIRGVPGVQSNLFGAGSDVHGNYFVRGLPNSGLGILVDGRLITNLNQEHFDLADLPVYNVERVEVLTGSGATLYGSNAVGGVVNVITRQPTKPLEGEIKVEFGSYGYSNYILNYSGKTDQLGYHFGYRQFDTSNDYYYEVPRPGRLFTGVRPNGYVHAKYYDLNLSYDFDDRNRLRLDSYLRGVTKGVAPFSIVNPDLPLVDPVTGEQQFELTRLNNQAHGIALTYDSKLGQGNDSELQVMAAIDRNLVVEASATDPADLGTYTDVSALNIQIRHNWQLNPSNNLTYGFDYIREFGRSGANDNSIFNFDTAAARPAFFALYTWKPFEPLLLTVGARETFPDPITAKGLVRSIPGSFDPSLGIRYQIAPGLAVRANFQQVYRAPNFNDLFGRTTHIGNPFLDPETGTAYDIGLDWQTGNTSLLRLTYFHSDISNLVDYLLVRNSCAANGLADNAPECANNLITEANPNGKYDNDPRTNAQRFRVGYPSVSTSGIEAAFNWQFAPSWSVFATETLTDSRVVQPPSAQITDSQLQQIGVINGSNEGFYRVDEGERNALIQTQYPLVPFSTTRLGFNYEDPNGLRVSLFGNISGGRSVDVNHVGPFDTTHPARLPPGSLLPGYTTLELTFGVPLGNTLTLTGYLDNLLGTYYERSYGNAGPGFNFRLGLASKF